MATKTQNPATILAQACAALAQVSQQLSAVVQMMNVEGDPSPFAAEPKRRGRPPVVKAEPQKVVFTAAEIEKIKFLMDTGTEKQDAMKKVFNLRGGAKTPAKTATAAKPTVKVAPKKKAIRMITREDVENDTYKLSEFTAHLKENGIEKDSEDWTSLKNKFLELRRKYKEEIEEENTIEEPEMTDDEQLMGEFATDGDDGGFDFSE